MMRQYGTSSTNVSLTFLQYASFSNTHMTYGYGKLKFRLVNMRYPVIFGLFTGGEKTGFAEGITSVKFMLIIVFNKKCVTPTACNFLLITVSKSKVSIWINCVSLCNLCASAKRTVAI